jgi:hypothetical protein
MSLAVHFGEKVRWKVREKPPTKPAKPGAQTTVETTGNTVNDSVADSVDRAFRWKAGGKAARNVNKRQRVAAPNWQSSSAEKDDD